MSTKSKTFSTSGGHRAQPTRALINSGETRADQDAAKYASIDFILQNFTRTGYMPTVDVQYGVDYSNVPTNVTDMMSQLDSVYELFSTLPSSIRSQMQNDIRNYPAYVASAHGRQQLMDAGFIPKPQEPEAQKAPESPTPAVTPQANATKE